MQTNLLTFTQTTRKITFMEDFCKHNKKFEAFPFKKSRKCMEVKK